VRGGGGVEGEGEGEKTKNTSVIARVELTFGKLLLNLFKFYYPSSEYS